MNKVFKWIDEHQYDFAIGADIGIAASCLGTGDYEACIGFALAAMWAYRTKEARRFAEKIIKEVDEMLSSVVAKEVKGK